MKRLAGFAIVDHLNDLAAKALDYLESLLFRRAFRKLSPELVTKKQSKQAEGAIFTDEEHREEDLMVQESSFSDPDWNRRDDLFPQERKKTAKRKTGRR